MITDDAVYGRMLCSEIGTVGYSAELLDAARLPSEADCSAKLMLADGDALSPEKIELLTKGYERKIVFSRSASDSAQKTQGGTPKISEHDIIYLRRPMSIAGLRELVLSMSADASERLIFDRKSRRLHLGSRECRLTPHEAAVFSILYDNRGGAVTRAEIDTALRRDNNTAERTNLCEVYIALLRRKLKSAFGSPLVETVRGIGYMLPNDR